MYLYIDTPTDYSTHKKRQNLIADKWKNDIPFEIHINFYAIVAVFDWKTYAKYSFFHHRSSFGCAL